VGAQGAFHLVHAEDIATVVAWLVDAQEGTYPRELVLGGPPFTVDDALDCVLTAKGHRRVARIDVGGRLAEVLIPLFRVRLAPWDRFCFERRQFVYRDAATPARFGLPTRYPTNADVMRAALSR
jgi:hypothetical protein